MTETHRTPRLLGAATALVLAVGCASGQEVVAGEDLLVLDGATLIDGRGGEPLTDSVVVIEGDRIVTVGARGSFRFLEDATAVDLAGHFLLPGFADVHAHVASPADDETEDAWERPWSAASEAALRSQLGLGITTIRNPGGPTEVAVALRDAVAAGEIPRREKRPR